MSESPIVANQGIQIGSSTNLGNTLSTFQTGIATYKLTVIDPPNSPPVVPSGEPVVVFLTLNTLNLVFIRWIFEFPSPIITLQGVPILRTSNIIFPSVPTQLSSSSVQDNSSNSTICLDSNGTITINNFSLTPSGTIYTFVGSFFWMPTSPAC